MTTKANGLTQVDYKRLMRACEREGRDLVFHVGRVIVVIPHDAAYLEKLAHSQPPAPDIEVREKPKARW